MTSAPDTLRVPLPDALRERLLVYRGALERLLAEYKRQAEEAPARLARLEADKDAVASEIHTLRTNCQHDDSNAIDAIATLETRLRVVSAQLDTARETVAGLATPPRLNSAGDILQLIRDLTAHWREALPPMIAAQLRPFCADEREAQDLAVRTEVVQSLGRLRDAWVWRRAESATHGNVESLNRILERAMRGQPALTFDLSPEPTIPSAPPAQPDSTAICEKPPGTAEAEIKTDSVLGEDGPLLHAQNPRCGQSAAPGTSFRAEAVQA